MLGFKQFETASVTIRGIELAEKIKKNQFPRTIKAPPARSWAFDLFRSDGLDAAFSRRVEPPQSVVDGCPTQGIADGSGGRNKERRPWQRSMSLKDQCAAGRKKMNQDETEALLCS